MSPSYLLLLLYILQLQWPSRCAVSASLTAACAIKECWCGHYLAALLEFLKLACCIGFANNVLRLFHVVIVSVLVALLSFMMRCVRFIVRGLVIILLFFIILLHHVVFIVCQWSLNDLKRLYFLLLRGNGGSRVSWGRIFWEIAWWC